MTSIPPTSNTTNTQTIGDAISQASQPGGALGQDQFMQMLVAQLQNQDPLNPMDGDQMASELAQFSSLSELQQINTTLTGQSSSSASLLGGIQSSAAIAMIGHTVTAVGNQVQIGGTDGQTSVTADVPTPGTGTLQILDSSGNVVGSRSLGGIVAGDGQTFDLGDAASGLPAGVYTYAINVTDSSGQPVTVTTYTIGKVDGVGAGQSGLAVTAGGLSIPYASIVKVSN